MDFDLLSYIIQEGKPANLGGNAVLFLFAWKVIKGSMKDHFTSVQKSLEQISLNIQMLNQTIISHSVRIEILEKERLKGEKDGKTI